MVVASFQADPDTVFSGYITPSGLGGNNKLPPGWTVEKPVPGRYNLDHGLNLSEPRDIHIVLTLHGSDGGGLDAWRIHVNTRDADGWVIHTEDASGTKVEAAFYFVAIIYQGT